jgi:hypothetical protein
LGKRVSGIGLGATNAPLALTTSGEKSPVPSATAVPAAAEVNT